MVRMRARHGVTGFSHDGESHEVDEHGHIEVNESHVEAAKSHGFEVAHEEAAAVVKKIEQVVDDLVHMSRTEALEMLEHLGVVITGHMNAGDLVAALKGACAGVAAKIERDVEKAKDAVKDAVKDVATEVGTSEAPKAEETKSDAKPEDAKDGAKDEAKDGAARTETLKLKNHQPNQQHGHHNRRG